MKTETKEGVVAFILGLMIGYKVLYKAYHFAYWCLIAAAFLAGSHFHK